jgi:cytoskeleton protein RodZ
MGPDHEARESGNVRVCRPTAQPLNPVAVPDDMTRLNKSEIAGEAARFGDQLREAREGLGLTLEDIAENLRIRQVYLAALEEGRLRELPAPAYATGFVRSYARALGLDADSFVRRFLDVSGTAPRKPTLVFPEPVPERGTPTGALLLGGAALALLAYLGWYSWSSRGPRTVDAVPPPPPAIEQAARPPAPAPPPVGMPPYPSLNPTAESAPAPAPVAAASVIPGLPAGTRIALRATDEVWVRVRPARGGKSIVNKVLKAGDVVAVPVEDIFILSTGNIAQLEIFVDNKPYAGFDPGLGPRSNIALVPERLKTEKIPAVAERSKPRPAAPRG